MALKLLTTGNGKLLKGEKAGYLSAGLHLAPHKLSGFNTCPMASAGCAAACLNTAGRGIYQRTQDGRIKKTLWFFNDRAGFMAQLLWDIRAMERKAARGGQKLAVRLNLTSDIQWETILIDGKTVFEHFPHISFYDYTKIPKRVLPGSEARRFANYHLTFSRSEANEGHVSLAIASGANVAVVFAGALPKEYLGRPVVSGDENDLRFLDPKGVIVGLSTKGKAKRDASGFVVQSAH